MLEMTLDVENAARLTQLSGSFEDLRKRVEALELREMLRFHDPEAIQAQADQVKAMFANKIRSLRVLVKSNFDGDPSLFANCVVFDAVITLLHEDSEQWHNFVNRVNWELDSRLRPTGLFVYHHYRSASENLKAKDRQEWE